MSKPNPEFLDRPDVKPVYTIKPIYDDRYLLNEGLRERGYFAHARWPADIYILELAGIDVMSVPANNSLGKYGYWGYVFMPDKILGKKIKIRLHDGTTAKMWHQYTFEQKVIVQQYWHLLSDESKFEEEE